MSKALSLFEAAVASRNAAACRNEGCWDNGVYGLSGSWSVMGSMNVCRGIQLKCIYTLGGRGFQGGGGEERQHTGRPSCCCLCVVCVLLLCGVVC